jgi:hypothetical protein
VRHDWDELVQALLFIAFGVWGLVGAARLFAQSGWIASIYTVFMVEFVAIGVLLLFARRANSWALRRRAYLVFSAALGMFALLLFISSMSPFSVLAMAFAVQGVVTMRLLTQQERVTAAVIAIQAEDERRPPH